ncbi:hypothetical protein LTR27_010279 [Elasticomyces elasticus]|nr:hypothetical protein LTR27_010279 [Elasticomyces elasticus]
MGKEIPWAQHWDKIVRLYDDPHYSLTKLMKELEKDGFKASRRAYCYKLKKEGVSGMVITRSATPHSSAMDLDRMELSPEALPGLHQNSFPQEQISDNQLSDRRYFDLGGSLDRQLLGLNHARDEVEQYIRDSASLQGKDTILHQCVRFSECNHHVNTVLAVMHDAGLNVDVADDKGRTALRLAVEANELRLVDILLRAGASVNTKDGVGDSPLHVAFRSRMFLMGMILLGADADGHSPNVHGESPLTMLVEFIFTPEGIAVPKEQLAALDIARKLLDCATNQNRGPDERLFALFIEKSFSQDYKASTASIDLLLTAFVTSGYALLICSAGHAPYHAPFDDMWDRIVEVAATLPGRPHDQALMDVLLQPCPYRQADINISDRAQSLIESGFAFQYQSAQAGTLSKILQLDESEEGQKMLELFVQLNIDAFTICPLRIFVESRGQTRHHQNPNSEDYGMAALLLRQDPGLVMSRHAEYAEHYGSVFIHHPGLQYVRYLMSDYRRYLRDYLNNGHGTSTGNLPSRMKFKAYHYVLELLTKRLVTSELPKPQRGTQRSRIMAALRIRTVLKMPGIPIDSNALVRCISDPIVPGSEEASIFQEDATLIDMLLNNLNTEEYL